MKWNSYRVTKYNPQFRDENGYFTLKEDWTSIYDVDKTFEVKVFTMDEYLIIEKQYLSSILYFMNHLGVSHFNVIQLEDGNQQTNLYENMVVNKEEALNIVKLMLREELWCKLVCENMEIHVGYDFYMYLLTKSSDDSLPIDQTLQLGLFVENVTSPYLTN